MVLSKINLGTITLKHKNKKSRSTNVTGTLGTNPVMRLWMPETLAVCVFVGLFLGIAWTFHLQGRYLSGIYWWDFFDFLGHIPHILGAGLGGHILIVAAIWFLFIGIGDCGLRALWLTGIPRPERLLLSAGLGGGITFLALLALGLCGFWNPTVLRAIFWTSVAVVGGAILYRAHWGRAADSVGAANPDSSRNLRWSPAVLFAVILMTLAAIMTVAATNAPEVFFDSLVYHLALPKYYLMRHRIVATPGNLYSGIPFGVEMLYGLVLSLSDETSAELLHCTFGIATTLAVWLWLRRQAGERAGVLGGLVFYLCPLVLYSGWLSGVDLAASFFVMLALISLSRGLETPGTEQHPSWAIAAGIFLGFAMGVKYTVLPVGAAFVLTHLGLGRRHGEPARNSLWMSVAALATFSPWLLKNFVFYGNPFYPFLHSLFGQIAPADWGGFLSDARSRDLLKTFSALSGWQDLLIQPWAISVGIRQHLDWLGPVFLMLLPGILFLRWGLWRRIDSVPAAWSAAALIAAGGYAAWLLTSTLPRFLIPVLPVIACVGVLALERGAFPNWLRRSTWAAILLASINNFQIVIAGGGWTLDRWPLLRDRISRAVYLKTDHVSYNAPYYAAMEFINQQLPANAKILFLGESRAYYCERDYIATTVFDRNPFWTAVREAKSASDIFVKMKSMGVTHVFLNVNELCAHTSLAEVLPRELAMSPRFAEFWARYLRKVFEKRDRRPDGGITGHLVVYELRDSPSEDVRSFPENLFWDVLKSLNQAHG